MPLPTSSRYPDALDDNNNLFLARDAIRLRLAEDYNPGDTEIKAEGNELIAALMPPDGIITLTEQCSDLEDRAISFHYTTFELETMTFSGLTLLDGFRDVYKAHRITNITLNVMAEHHNHIKNALIAIESFGGIRGTVDREPFGPTLEGRINFLRQLVLRPKAWFRCDKRTGNVPLTVEFCDMSFRLATDGNSRTLTHTWDFGDNTTSMVSYISVVNTISEISTISGIISTIIPHSTMVEEPISTISATDAVPSNASNIYVHDTDAGCIRKTYYRPGIYDVKLTVANDFGSNTVIFPELINARVKSPQSATIDFIANTEYQDVVPGVPPNGPYVITPTIRSPINTLIEISIQQGENPEVSGYSFAGELLDDSGTPVDSIATYTWGIADDLNHPSDYTTKASFSVGGVYDLKLRVDTEFGAYRITSYENAFDIVENINLWLWMLPNENSLVAWEYGLISETFKLAPSSPYTVFRRNYSFLEGRNNAEQQIKEFKRNTGFASLATRSGSGGTCMLYWASGRNASDPPGLEEIKVAEFSGFTGLYVTRPSIGRQWNWANLNSSSMSYFVFGDMPSRSPNLSYTNLNKQSYDLQTRAVIGTTMTSMNFLNGAQELDQNEAAYQEGTSAYGDFSIYRTTWKDNTGYIVRNAGVGQFMRLKSFYQTEGTLGTPFTNIRKMQDLQGPTKLEGGLVSMNDGIFFLNNSGSVSKFTPTESLWRTGGPGANSLSYRGLQDTTVQGYDASTNTVLLASDSDHRAYMSFDYSTNAFIKFNDIDLTFSSLGSRPSGEQFAMGVY